MLIRTFGKSLGKIKVNEEMYELSLEGKNDIRSRTNKSILGNKLDQQLEDPN